MVTPAPSAELLAELEDLAVELAHLAGAQIADTLGTEIVVEYKREAQRTGTEPTNPVSEVDKAVEAMIRDRVGARFPDHAIVGEEVELQPDPSMEYVWVIDPVDGTTNAAQGLPNSISVMAASERREGDEHVMKNLTTLYSTKMAYGPEVVRAIAAGLTPLALDDPMEVTLGRLAEALGKRIPELVVMTLNRPRHADIIAQVRKCGAALRLISDGDITAAVSPSLVDSGVDLFYGIGGSPEGILTAAALKALGGEMLLRMWPRDDAERAAVLKEITAADLDRVWTIDELVRGKSAIFCATGISDSPLLPGVRIVGKKAITHSILMRAKSRTVRYIRAEHDLECKTIHLRSVRREAKI